MFDDVEIANGRALVRGVGELRGENQEFHMAHLALRYLAIHLQCFLRRAFPRKGCGAL